MCLHWRNVFCYGIFAPMIHMEIFLVSGKRSVLHVVGTSVSVILHARVSGGCAGFQVRASPLRMALLCGFPDSDFWTCQPMGRRTPVRYFRNIWIRLHILLLSLSSSSIMAERRPIQKLLQRRDAITQLTEALKLQTSIFRFEACFFLLCCYCFVRNHF